MDYIVTVIVAIAAVVLALMASQIDIEVEPQNMNVPKIKINFRKDSSFYGFFKPSKTPDVSLENEDEPYINTLMVGEAHINYGDDAATLAKCEVTLKAKSPVDEYYYLGADPNTTFKRVDGFIDKDKTFKAIKDYKSWDGTTGSGLFFNLHRITLPIKSLYIGQILKLKYNLQLYIHYREVTKGVPVTYHSYFFRCLNSTDKAVFKYVLPKGKQSRVIRFDIINEFSNKEILNHELEVKEGVYNLPDDYGVVWISITEEFTTLQWSTARKSPRGTLYKLKWYTEALH